MNIQPSIDLKKVNLQSAVGYLISLHENEYQWNLLGVKVVGVAATEADIPEGIYEYGDAYEVGTEPPYDLYIYTRPDGVVHTEGYWFNTGKFPMPGPQGPKGDGLEQITREESKRAKSVTYDSNLGATIDYAGKTLTYTDSTTGETKTQTYPAQLNLPIVPGKYVSIDTRLGWDGDTLEVKVDDTALALDYIQIDKTRDNRVPLYTNGKINWTLATEAPSSLSIAHRDGNGDCIFRKLKVNRLSTTANEYDMPLQAAYYGGFSDGFTIEKTPTDTGTLTAALLSTITAYPNAGIKYDNQSYVRMDPTNAPNGTLNYIHIDSIDDGNGGYKATGKCFSITVSTREWQVVDLDFGSSSRTTHNLTITNSSTGMSIYFSLTNNRPETYEGAPAGLLSALENSQIACTVDANGTYSAGMITTDGTNFKATYGNGEEALIEQMQVSITDSMV